MPNFSIAVGCDTAVRHRECDRVFPLVSRPMYSRAFVGRTSKHNNKNSKGVAARLAVRLAVFAVTLGLTAPVGSADPGPQGRQVVAAEPLNIVVIGDSVAGQLSLALDHHWSGPIITYVQSVGARYQDEASLEKLRSTVQAADPDLVVAMFGTWDAMSFFDKGGRAWTASYRTQLAKWRNAIGHDESPFMWVLMPDIADENLNPRVREINRVVATQHGERSLGGQSIVVRSSDVLDIDGRFASTLPDLAQRTRSIDGLHLCAAGALLVANHVLSVDTDLARGQGNSEKYSTKNVPNFLANTPFSSDGCADPA